MINDDDYEQKQCKEAPKKTPTAKELKEYLDDLNPTSNPSYYKLVGLNPLST